MSFRGRHLLRTGVWRAREYRPAPAVEGEVRPELLESTGLFCTVVLEEAEGWCGLAGLILT